MSTTDVAETKRTGYLATWKKYPFEIKVMDLATLVWLALGLVNIILFMLSVELTIRSFSSFFFPLFMVVVTFSLRLKLVEKPDQVKKIFITWALFFGLMVLGSVLVLIFYPPLI